MVVSFNVSFLLMSGYFATTTFIEENGKQEVTFYDSVTTKPLFVAPRGRSWQEFIVESRAHGWYVVYLQAYI